MKRQAIITTIKELQRIIEEFEKENTRWEWSVGYCDEEQPFQLNIINNEGLSDTWKFEFNSQRKKNKDDGSNVSLFGNPKQPKGKINKDEHMPLSVDNHADNYKRNKGLTFPKEIKEYQNE